MAFKVPKFEDGKTLSENNLYSLAQLSKEFFRWTCIAGKNFGFFAPSGIDLTPGSNSWNEFNWENDNLFVSNLFVISPQGYPFILQGQKKIEKAGKILFAVACLAKDSQSYDNEGYKIDFRWDYSEIESNQEEGTFLIELGQATENNNDWRFSITPPILQLNGTSKFWETLNVFRKNIGLYIDQLIIAVGESNLDCSEYIDRLERLNIFSKKDEVDGFINNAILTLKSAAGFYHRLIYHQDRSNSEYQSCESLQGRALEKKLKEIHGNRIENKIFSDLDVPLQMKVQTGQEQQSFIEKLSALFASTSRLFEKLQTNRQGISPSIGYPKLFQRGLLLHRYDLKQYKEEGQRVVVEFNVEPSDVSFTFAPKDNIKNLETLFVLRQHSKKNNPNEYQYELLLPLKDYLFIASPSGIIKKVELLKSRAIDHG